MAEDSTPIEVRPVTPEQVPTDRTLERFRLTRFPNYVVEIGYGEHPVPLIGNLRFGEYVGFDRTFDDGESKHPDYAMTVRKILTGFREEASRLRPGEKISLGFGDAVRDESQGRMGIPLPDDIADEVYAGDVLNARFDEEGKDQERRNILEEAKRVLAPDGRIIIKVSWHNDASNELPLETSEQLLTDNGFTVIDSCDASQPEYQEFEARYGRSSSAQINFAGFDVEGDSEDKSYFVVARKA